MERRGFLRLLGLAVAGAAVGVKLEQPEMAISNAQVAKKLVNSPVNLGISHRAYLEKGFVFAPYIPLHLGPQVVEEMSPKVGVMSRYITQQA